METWLMMTSNVTAWASTRRQFESLVENIDVVCVQEHHVLASSWQDVEHNMQGFGYKTTGHPATPRAGHGSHGSTIRGGLHVISIYLQAGVLVHKQLPCWHELAGYIRSLQQPWVCMGDVNCTPAELHSTGLLEGMSGTFVTQNLPTCTSGRGRILDFGVIATSIRHRVHVVELLELSQ
eukprot:1572982-Amphidinium_carterae.1